MFSNTCIWVLWTQSYSSGMWFICGIFSHNLDIKPGRFRRICSEIQNLGAMTLLWIKHFSPFHQGLRFQGRVSQGLDEERVFMTFSPNSKEIKQTSGHFPGKLRPCFQCPDNPYTRHSSANEKSCSHPQPFALGESAGVRPTQLLLEGKWGNCTLPGARLEVLEPGIFKDKLRLPGRENSLHLRRLSCLSFFLITTAFCLYGKYICSNFPTPKMNFNCDTRVGHFVFLGVGLIVKTVALPRALVFVFFFGYLYLVRQHIAVTESMNSVVVLTCSRF